MGRPTVRASDDPFVEWLERTVKAIGINWKTLAVKANKSQSFISMLRSGKTGYSRETVEEIARALYNGDPADEDRLNAFITEAVRAAYRGPSAGLDVDQRKSFIWNAYSQTTGPAKTALNALMGVPDGGIDVILADPPFTSTNVRRYQSQRQSQKQEIIRKPAYDDNEAHYGIAAQDNHPSTQAGVDASKRDIEERARMREELDLGAAGRAQAAILIRAYCCGKGDRELVRVTGLTQSVSTEMPYLAIAQVKYGEALATEYFLANLQTGNLKSATEDDKSIIT